MRTLSEARLLLSDARMCGFASTCERLWPVTALDASAAKKTQASANVRTVVVLRRARQLGDEAEDVRPSSARRQRSARGGLRRRDLSLRILTLHYTARFAPPPSLPLCTGSLPTSKPLLRLKRKFKTKLMAHTNSSLNPHYLRPRPP